MQVPCSNTPIVTIFSPGEFPASGREHCSLRVAARGAGAELKVENLLATVAVPTQQSARWECWCHPRIQHFSIQSSTFIECKAYTWKCRQWDWKQIHTCSPPAYTNSGVYADASEGRNWADSLLEWDTELPFVIGRQVEGAAEDTILSFHRFMSWSTSQARVGFCKAWDVLFRRHTAVVIRAMRPTHSRASLSVNRRGLRLRTCHIRISLVNRPLLQWTISHEEISLSAGKLVLNAFFNKYAFLHS